MKLLLAFVLRIVYLLTAVVETFWAVFIMIGAIIAAGPIWLLNGRNVIKAANYFFCYEAGGWSRRLYKYIKTLQFENSNSKHPNSIKFDHPAFRVDKRS